MIQVTYIEKIPKGPKGENIERKVKETKKFDKPESYNDFISKIANHFKISKKNIELICLNFDGDEIGINNDDDLNENLDEAKEFYVFSGYEFEEKPKKEKENEDEDKDEDKDKDEDEDDEYKIDIKDEEIEEIINSQIKEVEIDENLNDVNEFDINKYKKELIKKNENFIQNIENQFDKKITDIYIKNTNLIKDNINNIIDKHSKEQIDITKKLNNDTKMLNEEFSEIANDINQINFHMRALSEKLDNYKLKVKFEKEVINLKEIITMCDYFIIENIKIQNIGNKVLNNLYFIRDKKQSSEDFIFNNVNSNNIYKLNQKSKSFSPGKTEIYSIKVKIKNPKPEHTYKLILYISEDEEGQNLSKSLEINCYVIYDDGSVKAMFDELEEEYNLSSILYKYVIIDKIIELKCDRDAMNEWIDELM